MAEVQSEVVEHFLQALEVTKPVIVKLCREAFEKAEQLQAELTTSRATCARLQEDVETKNETISEQIQRIKLHIDEVVIARRERDVRHAETISMQAQVATLTAALRRYGQHEKGCDVLLSTNELHGVCTCGLAAVLRAASEGA